jgi:hypothetical protein
LSCIGGIFLYVPDMKNSIGYGHQGLSVVAGVPHVDSQNLERSLSQNRYRDIPGSASGGFMDDAASVLAAANQSLGGSGTLTLGLVHQVVPGLLAYRVITADHSGELICGDAMSSGYPQSARVGQFYPVGSLVLVFRHSTGDYGTILGFAANPGGGRTFAPEIAGTHDAHYYNRVYTREIVTSSDLGEGFPNYQQWRPGDLCDGDYSIMTMFGGGFHTDLFQTSLRQSRDCGLWLFSLDKLARLVGRSIQEFSFAHERYAGMDEYETYGFEGTALYPWEARGFFSEDAAKSKQEEETTAVPFYRTRRYTGFLGQGIVQEVLVPPKDVDREKPFTESSEDVPICVSREQALLDGTLLFESAQAIHLVKHANIRTFKRVNEIDNPNGDDLAKGNYTFSKTPAPPNRPDQNNSVTDQILWTVREQAPAAFKEHAQDFHKIEPDKQIFEKDVQTGDVASLKRSDHIQDPPTAELFIDERYKDVKISGSRASISILPSGGIALRGSCGEEILLQGGNITLSAPGDIRLMPGRSLISLAGDDTVFRSKNSIDLTATDNDVRIKAERNLDMVGGMSGTGRTLLENKAEKYPTNKDVQGYEGENIGGRGLILRAEKSLVGTFGKRIYTRAVDNGDILLDADEGRGNIRSRANYFEVETVRNIDLGAGTGQTILTVSPTSVTSSSTLRVFENVYVHQRVVATNACNNNPTVKPVFDDKAVQTQEDNKENFHTRNGHYFQEQFYDENLIGTEDAIRNYTFSYRTTDQCGAGRFAFTEPYWMELYGEKACSTLVSWNEPVYKYQDTIDQLPWPGYEAWENDPSVEKNKTDLFDAETGLDSDNRGSGSTGRDSEKETPADFFKIMDPN